MKTLEPFFKNSILTKISITLLIITTAISCSKDDEPAPVEIIKSAEKELTSFSFLSTNNTVLTTDVVANINATAKTLIANLPSDSPLTALTPTIAVSAKASISPQGAQDFTNPITYTVTAEDGSNSSYTITANSKSSAKELTSFVFLLTNNPIEINVVATIDEENKTVSATMPIGTNITGLIPEIIVSNNATVSPASAQNFTTPIKYTVTSEDESTVIYTITIIAQRTQRQILQAILDVNPNNTLEWNLNNTLDLGLLPGVTTNTTGKITELELHIKNIAELPSEIGQLSKLTDLSLFGNQLSSLPAEIVQLDNLEELSLGANPLKTLPTVIGQLTNLRVLSLQGTQLASLPTEIGQLVNLTDLNLTNNQLTALPVEIRQLINLEYLRLNSNQLTSLPRTGIGQLTKLRILPLSGNQLTSLPSELWQLVNLEYLGLSNNKLTELPEEIGQLVNLERLDLGRNQLTSMPQETEQLVNLDYLSLASNQLSFLPSVLPRLTSLTELILYNNQLSSLSAKLSLLTNLNMLDIRLNPLTDIPQSICDLEGLTISADPGVGCD